VVSFLLVLPFWAASRVVAWLLAVKTDPLRLSLLVVIVLLFILTVACLVAVSTVSPRIRPRVLYRLAGVSQAIRRFRALVPRVAF
jgi:hypothetical protein